MRNVIYIFIALIVVAIAVLAFMPKAEAPAVVDQSPGITDATTFTMADVVARNATTSCWTVINGNIYDLTEWVSEHPGGPEAIEFTCGKDATDAFMSQHGGQEGPMQGIESFRIGTLAR